MAGHSKWANIKRRKGAVDAKRGEIWNRISKEITIAARIGGSGDPDANPRLRSAIQAAKQNNMPNDNINRAIKKGTGEIEGAMIEEVTYEGYGVGGVAIIVEAATDNKNRTLPEIRAIFNKHGGNMGDTGSVAYMFDQKGIFEIPKEQIEEDELMELALEAGADDIKTEGESYEVTTPLGDFYNVKTALEGQGLEPTLSEATMIPQTNVTLDKEKAESILKLIDAIEDNEDVQKVYANFDIPDEIMDQLAE